MDKNCNTESVEAGKRDKLSVRLGYDSHTYGNHAFIVLDSLKGKEQGLSFMLKPDISEALEMPGGVSDGFLINKVYYPDLSIDSWYFHSNPDLDPNPTLRSQHLHPLMRM